MLGETATVKSAWVADQGGRSARGSATVAWVAVSWLFSQRLIPVTALTHRAETITKLTATMPRIRRIFGLDAPFFERLREFLELLISGHPYLATFRSNQRRRANSTSRSGLRMASARGTTGCTPWSAHLAKRLSGLSVTAMLGLAGRRP